MSDPALPYNGTEGWSGSETSRERAEREAANGDARSRQEAILRYLRRVGAQGATWRSIDTALGIDHHGKTSGSLSVLHAVGAIQRTTTRRDGCQVYVHADFVDAETPVVAPRSQRVTPAEQFARAFQEYVDASTGSEGKVRWRAAMDAFRSWQASR